MKTVLIHDWLIDRGGAENVLSSLLELYPSAPIFTLFYDPKGTASELINGHSIATSFLQRYPRLRRYYRSFLPLFPIVIEQFDLSEYDLVISSSHAVAKGVITHPNQLHISYVHSPMRYAWDLQSQYLSEAKLTKGIKSILARLILHYVRLWDTCAASRVDEFIVNSRFIAQRVAKFYRRKAKVIYPPVDVHFFDLCPKKDNYYVTISRFVPYKKVHLIVEAFARLPSQKLVVIGDGPDRPKIT